MSIQTEITRISSAKDDIIDALSEKGVDATGASIDTLGEAVRSISSANVDVDLSEYLEDAPVTGLNADTLGGFTADMLTSNIVSNCNSYTDNATSAISSFITDKLLHIGYIFETFTLSTPSEVANHFGIGTWSLLDKYLPDTGWKDFSWTNSTYIGTTQSSYTKNKWRVKNNVLYVEVGAGATSTISTSTEVELARIPITGNSSFSETNARIWTAGVGGSGAVCGFYMVQNTDYISVHLKPHTSSNFFAAPWYSCIFAVPLDDDYSIDDGVTRSTFYKYIRIA